MKFRLPVLIVAALLVYVDGIPLSAQQIVVNKDNRTIAVTASAEAKAEADTATVHIGFLSYGPTQDAAYADGSKISNAIQKALTGSGVPRESIESESQSFAPVQQYGNQDWTPEEKVQRKFQVQQSWTVKTAAKDASQVLDVAVKAGANESGQIDWGVADDDGLQAKAAALALTRARQIGQQMAQGLNAGLGPLIYASNEAPVRPVEPLVRMAAAAPMAAKVEPLAINARKVIHSATVYAVFTIQ
ncbi:MAG TPA: SIMPL domain-containing protein [Acidobacteriaceae bacterium]